MMHTNTLGLVVITCCVVGALALKLPSYVNPCSRNDPDINACVLKSGRETIRNIFTKGFDRKYNVPPLNPIAITEMTVDQKGLKLTFRNLKLYGLHGAELLKAKIDFKGRHEEYDVVLPRIEIISDYTVAGRILVLPIRGSGDANITIHNLKVRLSHDYDLVKGKSGKEHLATKNPKLVFEPTKGYIYLSNLFGNKELSDNMNVFLNENSEDVINDVGPGVAEAMMLVIEQMYNNIHKVVAFDDFYPETV